MGRVPARRMFGSSLSTAESKIATVDVHAQFPHATGGVNFVNLAAKLRESRTNDG
jgi:hypothetical protein